MRGWKIINLGCNTAPHFVLLTYSFHSKSTVYSCLNVKKLLARNKCEIWSLQLGTCKRVRDMTRTYSQMHRTNKYSLLSSIIWPVCLNGWAFVYEVNGCRFESLTWQEHKMKCFFGMRKIFPKKCTKCFIEYTKYLP